MAPLADCPRPLKRSVSAALGAAPRRSTRRCTSARLPRTDAQSQEADLDENGDEAACQKKVALQNHKIEQAIVAVESGPRQPAAKKRRGPKQEAKRLREQLQEHSFCSGHDFLKLDTARNKPVLTTAVVPASPTKRSASPASKSLVLASADRPSDEALVMSPGTLSFLDSLHTGLTPSNSPESKAKAEDANPWVGLVSAGAPRGARKGGKSKRQKEAPSIVGLDEFLRDAKLRRGGATTMLPLPPPEPSEGARSSRGGDAVGELRRALRTIDATGPAPSWLRATQVAESEEEQEEDDEGGEAQKWQDEAWSEAEDEQDPNFM